MVLVLDGWHQGYVLGCCRGALHSSWVYFNFFNVMCLHGVALESVPGYWLGLGGPLGYGGCIGALGAGHLIPLSGLLGALWVPDGPGLDWVAPGVCIRMVQGSSAILLGASQNV